MTTLAGSGSVAYADGQGSFASFNYPNGIAVGTTGFVYVDDNRNNRIRLITPKGIFL